VLDISRAERYFLITLLLSLSIFSGASYYKKTSPNIKLETVEINEPQISVNINTATLRELESLPGIGPVMAREIISFRDTFGGFKSKEGLKDVKGIGDKKFEKIRDLIIISE